MSSVDGRLTASSRRELVANVRLNLYLGCRNTSVLLSSSVRNIAGIGMFQSVRRDLRPAGGLDATLCLLPPFACLPPETPRLMRRRSMLA